MRSGGGDMDSGSGSDIEQGGAVILSVEEDAV